MSWSFLGYDNLMENKLNKLWILIQNHQILKDKIKKKKPQRFIWKKKKKWKMQFKNKKSI